MIVKEYLTKYLEERGLWGRESEQVLDLFTKACGVEDMAQIL